MSRLGGAVSLLAAVVLPGCLGGDDPPDARRGADRGQARGGTLIVKSVNGVVTLDPGMSAGDDGSTAVLMMHRPLYNYFPGDVQPDPDVAAAPPEISADGKTVTVRLRAGIRYGEPVNREIRSADVKYALERVFTRNVPNGYALRAYGDLAGLADFTAGRARGIAGIETPDRRTVVFRLRRGAGANFAGGLALYASAPVPKEYARRFDRESLSTYGDHAPPTGPYRVARHERGRRLVLERNPAWDPASDPRPAHLDRIDFRIGGDPGITSDQIASGSHMISGAFPIAPRVLRRLEREASEQIGTVPVAAVLMLALNTTQPPLDRLAVRQAIAAAVDRRLIPGVLGMRYTKLANHFLPPAMPGFREAGGFSAPVPFLRSPGGDRDLARSYLSQVPRAVLDRDLKLLVPNTPPALRQAAAEMAGNLREIGLDVDVRVLGPEGIFTLCSVPAKKVDMCFGGVFAPPDLPHFVLDLLFHGGAIRQTANFNWSQLDDPQINAALDAAAVTVDPEERAIAYGAVDRRIVATAAAVPLAWTTTPGIRSRDVAGPMSPGGWDPAFLSVN